MLNPKKISNLIGNNYILCVIASVAIPNGQINLHYYSVKLGIATLAMTSLLSDYQQPNA